MGLLEKILEIYKDHAKTLAAILLGALIAGGLGGGLWINSLKDSLAEQKTIYAAHSQLTEERYRTALTILSSKYETATSNFKKFKQEVLDGVAAIESSAVGLNAPQVSSTPPIPAATKLKNVVVKTRDLKLLVEKSESPEDPEVQKILNKVENYRYPPLAKGEKEFKVPILATIVSLITYGLLLSLGTLWTLGALSSHRIRRLFLKAWDVSLDSCMRWTMSIGDADDWLQHNDRLGVLSGKDRADWKRFKNRLKKTDTIRMVVVPPEYIEHGFIVLRGHRILGIFPERVLQPSYAHNWKAEYGFQTDQNPY